MSEVRSLSCLLQLLDELARRTVGYCGADLKGLATEACLCCLRRQYPQVYVSKMKLAVNLKYLVVGPVASSYATPSSNSFSSISSSPRKPLLLAEPWGAVCV